MNETYETLVGRRFGPIWIAKFLPKKKERGTPASVHFDPEIPMYRNEVCGDVLGFYHTHPGMESYTSGTDIATMEAWTLALGKPLVCLIRGDRPTDGILKAWWFVDDEHEALQVPVCEGSGGRFWGFVPFLPKQNLGFANESEPITP